MRRAWILVCLVVMVLAVGCDSTTQSHSGSGKFIIDEIVPEGSSRSAYGSRGSRDPGEEVAYELWLMPTKRGYNEPIRHENVSELKRFPVTENGTYEIPIQEFPEDSPSVVIIARIE
ncbi:MAG: hypothetical protein VB127_01730, partial [Sphaerochaeta sp.]|nr:hypothetical protein [Sphaerochaeta sp.]